MARQKAGPPIVRFYQLGHSHLDAALVGILTKIQDHHLRACLFVKDDHQAKYLDNLLWCFSKDSFLPHGLCADADPERQPILICTTPNDTNGATVIVLAHAFLLENSERFDMILDFVDGSNPEALNASRIRYRSYRDNNCQMEHWIQSEGASWQQHTQTNR